MRTAMTCLVAFCGLSVFLGSCGHNDTDSKSSIVVESHVQKMTNEVSA